MLKKIFYSLILFMSSLMLCSQRMVVAPLPTYSLLPVNDIHTVMQDSEGFMWYGTKGGGLCRDNGYQIDVFRDDRLHPGLIGEDNEVYWLAEDKERSLIYFNTRYQLFVLDKRDYSIREIGHTDGGGRVQAVTVLRDGSVWFAKGSKIHHLTADHQLAESYYVSGRDDATDVLCIMEDSRGTIWALGWKGAVMSLAKGHKQLVWHDWPSGVHCGMMVEDCASHCFWISTYEQGIVKYMAQAGRSEATLEYQHVTTATKERSATNAIFLDERQNMLWTLTATGLYCYGIRNGKLVTHADEAIIPKGVKSLSNMTIDCNGNVWAVGSSPTALILQRQITGLSHIDVGDAMTITEGGQVFCERAVTDEDDLWMYLTQKSIVLYDRRTRQSYRLPSDVGQLSANFIKKSSGRGIWAFGASRVYSLSKGAGSIQYEQVIDGLDHVSCLYDDGKGNLFIGTKSRLLVYNVVSHVCKTLSDVGVNAISSDARGNVYYISAHVALNRMSRNGTVATIDTTHTLSCLACVGGQVWAANRRGDVARIDAKDGALHIDEKASNAVGDAVKSLCADAAGHLWILTDKYIREYSPSDGLSRLLPCNVQSVGMGNFKCVMPSDHGGVTVSGTGGVLHLKSSADFLPMKSLAPRLTGIIIDGHKHIVGCREHEFDVDADVNSVELQFSSLNVVSAKEITIAYRIEGMENTWHYLPRGHNTVTLTGLSHGHYKVEIKATDPAGLWCEEHGTFVLHRLPAWWETWWAVTLYVIALLLCVIGVIRYYMNRQQEARRTQMREQLTQLKFRFYTSVSHELRTPLTLILAPLDSLIDNFTEEKALRLLPGIRNNAGRLLELINRLLDFRKLEMGQQTLNPSYGDIYDFVRSACESFRPLAQSRDIGFGCAVPERPLIIAFDSHKLQHVISNLLSNAFKFTPDGGSIMVSVNQMGEGKVQMVVSDTGCGIDTEALPHIFERFYQGKSGKDTDAAGTGIGLNMVQEFVRLHGGTIDVSSEVGRGTSFTVVLPTRQNMTMPKDERRQVKGTDAATVGKGKVSDSDAGIVPEIASDAPTVLLVDDNDEFRQFLAGELQERYYVLQAPNGQEAISIAQKEAIDIIVSDVMMPEMDGLQLCRHIKQDVQTSHIMVILLTAKIGEESRIEGMKSGADDYVGKPFNLEMLKLRISRLVQLHRERIRNFNQDGNASLTEVATSDTDHKFLEKMEALVMQNLNNSDWTLDALAEELCMSRSTFYRKVVSLTGQKPNDIIRSIRLRHAAQLLKQGKMTVSEIADIVGFSSSSYFCRCFKEKYGVQPGQYK